MIIYSKLFLKVLFFIFFAFQISSQADDISEFQIEGMSIGDSLLDYVSKEIIIIEKNRESVYANNDFFIIQFDSEFLKTSNTNTYKSFQVHAKTNDETYKIYSLSGMISFQDKTFNECKKKMRKISNELVGIFGKNGKEGKVVDYSYDPTGDSKTISTYFFLSDGVVRIICYDISKELEDKERWIDTLDVVVYNSEFREWLNNKAYK